MNENILAAVIRLDEAVPLGGIEPFNGAVGHVALSVLPDKSPAVDAAPQVAQLGLAQSLNVWESASLAPFEAHSGGAFAVAMCCAGPKHGLPVRNAHDRLLRSTLLPDGGFDGSLGVSSAFPARR